MDSNYDQEAFHGKSISLENLLLVLQGDNIKNLCFFFRNFEKIGDFVTKSGTKSTNLSRELNNQSPEKKRRLTIDQVSIYDAENRKILAGSSF